ncbi:MAG: poly(ADP-ribose) glycohydrolase domain-containing protein, partial [Planctomycetota bacterium]
MESSESTLEILPCLDSDTMAAQRKQELDIPRSRAAALGASAFDGMMRGYYLNARGAQVDWSRLVESARTGKRSFPPAAALPPAAPAGNRVTRVQVCNETTLRAAADLKARGHRPLALNFANGVTPGGGFLG